jgi:hypothetical protein
MFKVGKQTVLRVIQEVGEAAQAWHDEHFRGLTIQRLALDEQWSYVHTHKERMTKAQKRRRQRRLVSGPNKRRTEPRSPQRGHRLRWRMLEVPRDDALINTDTPALYMTYIV